MKNILIIYPHWIPSNLVGVQRVRLVANFLPRYGWHPIIVAVAPEYYEEPLVEELKATVNKDIEVHWCEGGKRRLGVGDIALRSFKQLVKKSCEVIQDKKIDFIWSPLPSFYTALVCRRVHSLTGVPYGLDYMDPWVHDFPGARFPNKAWMAKRAAQLLEPTAVRNVSLITGVTELSYLPVIERNGHLSGITTGFMPLGFDPNDYTHSPANKRLLWGEQENIKPIVYAGAFLPEAHYYFDMLFSILSELRAQGKLDEKLRFFFVGTGKGNLDSVADYARKYGVSDIVSEKTERISYLEVLNNLKNAFGVLAIGNRQPHYTASKIFQTILSGRRVFPVFHTQSTVCDILHESKSDGFLVRYSPDMLQDEFKERMRRQFLRFIDSGEAWNPCLDALDKYSAEASARTLTQLIEKALCKENV